MKSMLAAAAMAIAAVFSAAPAAMAEAPSGAPVVLAGDHGHWNRHHGGFSVQLHFGDGPRWHHRPRHGWHHGWHHGHGVIIRPRPVHRPVPVIRLTRAHIEWCYSRYRTYDHRTNLFVRKGGHHAHCVSPYTH